MNYQGLIVFRRWYAKLCSRSPMRFSEDSLRQSVPFPRYDVQPCLGLVHSS